MDEKNQTNPFDIVSVAAAMRHGRRAFPVHIFSAIQDSFTNSQTEIPSGPRLQKMIQGMGLYLRHDYQRKEGCNTTVWTCGETSLYSAAPSGGGEPPQAVLLIPSLINKSTILDLLPERSLFQYLSAQGFAVYLLDWGNPVKDPDCRDLSGITKRLAEAVKVVAEHSQRPVSAFGYCMGGTLLMRALLDENEGAEFLSHLSQAIFMAAPWDFDAEPAALTRQVRKGTPAAINTVADKGVLPVNWIQSVFATVTAEKVIDKYVRFSKLDQRSEKARLFTAVEDWLNDGVDLPAGIAHSCIQDWYGDNVTANMAVDRPLPVPALIIASQHDVLVPHASSMALSRYFERIDVLEPDTGHIGMITASRAVAEVWQPMCAWLSSMLD